MWGREEEKTTGSSSLFLPFPPQARLLSHSAKLNLGGVRGLFLSNNAMVLWGKEREDKEAYFSEHSQDSTLGALWYIFLHISRRGYKFVQAHLYNVQCKLLCIEPTAWLVLPTSSGLNLLVTSGGWSKKSKCRILPLCCFYHYFKTFISSGNSLWLKELPLWSQTTSFIKSDSVHSPFPSWEPQLNY